MGKRGPAKTPTKILNMRASLRGQYRNTDEPEPNEGIPDPPIKLEGEALRIWHYVTETIDDMGVLTNADGLTLARYCTIWVKWRDCEAQIAKHGSTYWVKAKSGDRMLRQLPHAQQAMKLSDQLLRIEQEYGLTAASRANVKGSKRRGSKTKGRFFGNKSGSRAG